MITVFIALPGHPLVGEEFQHVRHHEKPRDVDQDLHVLLVTRRVDKADICASHGHKGEPADEEEDHRLLQLGQHVGLSCSAQLLIPV